MKTYLDNLKAEYDEYEKALRIDLRDLSEVMAKQPGYYARVSALYADIKAVYESMKLDLDELKSNLNLQIRKELAERGERDTNDKVEALINGDADFKKAKEELIGYGSWLNRFEGLIEAFRQRAFMLRELNQKSNFELSIH